MRTIIHTTFITGWLLICPVNCYVPETHSVRNDILIDSIIVEKSVKEKQPEKAVPSKLETYLVDCGLVDVKTIDSTLMVELRYSTANNFTGVVLYDSLDKCFMQPDVAEMLKRAHDSLKAIFPDYRILVWDGVRPFYVQQLMWTHVKGTVNERYVARPVSLHNFGCAVDVTIVDKNGNLLDMGTDYDYFGKASEPRYHDELLRDGVLNQQQIENRKLLKKVMKQAGFKPILTEWWHFNAFQLDTARENFMRIDGPELL